jgi:flagellar biosynthesis protein FliP
MRFSPTAHVAPLLVVLLSTPAVATETLEEAPIVDVAVAPMSRATLPPAVAQAIAESEPQAVEVMGEATRIQEGTEVASSPAEPANARTATETTTVTSASAGDPTATAVGLPTQVSEGAAMTAGETTTATKAEPATMASSSPTDPSIAGLLAELDASGAADENPTPAVEATVNPMARASIAFVLALMALAALLAHPRTRRVALERIRSAAGRRRSDEGPAFEVSGQLAVGTGQKVVTLEVDGVRLLVGLSQGRMDLLHTWGDPSSTPAAPESAATATDEVGSPILPPREEPAPPREPVREPAPSIDDVPLTVTPSASQLVQAWSRAAAMPTPAEVPLADEVEAPWWLEGATDDERERLVATAVEQTVEQPGADVAESVLGQLRARGHEPEAPVTRPAPATARRPRLSSLGSAEPAPEADEKPESSRRLPRMVLGLMAALTGVLTLGLAPDVMAADSSLALDFGSEAIDQVVNGDAGASTAVKLLVTLTLLAVAPAIVLSMTSFTRLIVVFSLMRQAIGVQQAPPNQVLVGLALFLTWFVMAPTFDQVNDVAVAPYFEGQMTEGEALTEAMGPMRDFMLKHTREKDLALFLRLSDAPRPETRHDVPTRALVPAFMISELKTAFQIGFLVYIPFLIIDLVVATILLAMGMMVLPPIVISLPFKLLLFVFVDGWNLLVGSMMTSFT